MEAQPAAAAAFDLPEVLSVVLPFLPLDCRARAACVCRTWRAAAGEAPLWAELDFEHCEALVDDATLAALCARAGAELGALRLTAAFGRVTGAGLVAALRDGGCASVRRVSAAQGPTLTLQQAAQLRAACPLLQRTDVEVRCDTREEATEAADALPGPLSLSFNPMPLHVTGFPPVALRRLLLCRSVAALDLAQLPSLDHAWMAAVAEAEAEAEEPQRPAEALGRALRENTTLTALNAPQHSESRAFIELLRTQRGVLLGRMLRVNSTLASINITGTTLDLEGVAALAGGLSENAALRMLRMARCDVCGRGAAALAEALHSNATLACLDLANNRVGDAGAVALADMCSMNTTLRELDLSDNRIRDEGGAAVGGALRDSAALTALDLSRNAIRAAGATALAGALRVNTALRTLRLNYNSELLTDIIEDADVRRVLLLNGSLTALELGGVGLSEAGVTALASALRGNSSLTELDLSANVRNGGVGVGDAAAAALADVLRENATLRKLKLDYCSICAEGAAQLAAALGANASLTALHLSGNVGIGVGGTAALGAALRGNATLRLLALSTCEIGEAATVALAGGLRGNAALTRLDLDRNRIGNRGAAALAEVLRDNVALEVLDLSTNYVHGGGAAALAEMLRVNGVLQTLRLSLTKMDDAGKAALEAVRPGNTPLVWNSPFEEFDDFDHHAPGPPALHGYSPEYVQERNAAELA